MQEKSKIRYTFNSVHQLVVVLLLALGVNCNTLFNDYALDDVVVLTENQLVQKGIAGIPDLMRTDYVYGYSQQSNILTGSRYRPLTLICFAMEYQFFGANPFVSHFVNLILLCCLLFLLLQLLHKYLFTQAHPLLSFITCCLFAVHPIHTEVIANVKSRDELLAFIFILLSALFAFRSLSTKARKDLLFSLCFFLLALLTKETALTFLGVLPLLFYFFTPSNLRSSIRLALPFLLVFMVYLGIRYFTVGFTSYPVNDVTNSPYIYASISEAFATKVFVLYHYLRLVAFPFSLCSDYGYNQLPYVGLTSLSFGLSFILITLLFSISAIYFKRKSLISFCILYFFITLSVGTNFIVDLGAPLAERMLFEPSLGFCMLLAMVMLTIQEKNQLVFIVGCCGLLIAFSIKTISRNAEWKNSESLILTDVETAPECSRLNLYACEKYLVKANLSQDTILKQDYLNRAIKYGEKSLALHSKFAYSYQRLGAAYYAKKELFKAADLWIKAAILDSTTLLTKEWLRNLSFECYVQGNSQLEQSNNVAAIRYYLKSTELNSNAVESWYNMGGAYFILGDSLNGKRAWNKVIELNPMHTLNKNDFK